MRLVAGVNCGGLSLDGDSRVFVKTFLLNVLTRDPESAAERLHCRDNTCRPPEGEETIVALVMGAMGGLREKQDAIRAADVGCQNSDAEGRARLVSLRKSWPGHSPRTSMMGTRMTSPVL